MHITSIIGKALRDSLPELSFVMKALRTGKEISAGNIALGSTGKRYYVECLAIKENDKVIGLKVSIKTAEQIRKYSAGAQRNNAVYNFQDIIAVSSGMKLVKSEARGGKSGERADNRGVRHGKGTFCTGYTQCKPSLCRTVCANKLRRIFA